MRPERSPSGDGGGVCGVAVGGALLYVSGAQKLAALAGILALLAGLAILRR
jgi:hypothetical protein